MKPGTLSLTKVFGILMVNLLFFAANTYAQRDTTLNQPNQSGTFVAPHAIRLAPGFSTAAGQSFRAYIDPNINQCQPLNLQLSNNQNYIVTYTPLVAGVTNPAATNNSACNVMVDVQYFDGLGRPLQNIEVKGSPTFRDIVQPIAYDAYNRETTKYLSYTVNSSTSSNGSFQTNAIADQGSFYANPTNPTTWNAPGVPKINFPYMETGFEPSPLNRVLEQGSPGDNWQLTGKPGATNPGHTVKYEYATNDASSLTSGSGRWAKMYGVALDANGKPTLVDQGSYGANQLYVTITKDQNWVNADGKDGIVEEYKDKQGRIVLNRAYNNGGVAHSTYFVFDDIGNLSYVLPPAIEPDNGGITLSALSKLGYQYQYDGRNRVVEKKIPGKGREYTVFNKLDQAVAYQDSVLRLTNQWSFTKYDAFGKVVLTGVWNNGGTAISRINLQSQVDAISQNWESRDNNNASNYYYSSVSFPTNNIQKVLTVNYYDDYIVPNLPSIYDKHLSYSAMTKGLLTIALSNVLGTSDMLWSVHYYDDNGRLTKTFAQHYLGGSSNLNVANYDETSNTYNFTDVLIASTRNHHVSTGALTTIVDSLVYDHRGRQIQAWNRINNGPNTLTSKQDYNEVGQVRIKHLNATNSGASFLQDIGYSYNERGWLTKDSSSLFVMQLKYNDGTNPQFNGNIANQYWGTGNLLSKNYAYNYDKLNRLTAGISNENFTEQNITYDKGGNLLTLSRTDPRIPATVNLVYHYDGNQLKTVDNLVNNPYEYDGNGNATYDSRNDVHVSYNFLNLPQNFTGSKTLAYTYDADGNKLRRVSSNSSVGATDYVNGIQYKNGAIEYIRTTDGLARRNQSNGDYSYEYSLSDHLSNSRVSFDNNNGTARMIQQDDYYPYGLNYNRYAFGNKTPYLYNKKELQEELGQYDYGSRFYDPVIGRFLVIDKYAEKFQGVSTYQYAALDPIKNIDVNGDSVKTAESTPIVKGKHIYITRTTTITGKVYDATGQGKADALAGALNDKLNNSTGSETVKNKNGTVTHYTYKIDSKFTAAHSVEDVKRGDNVVAVVSKVTGKSANGVTDAAGVTNKAYGLVAFVQDSPMAALLDYAYHEVGHELGFIDHFDGDKTDPMDYNGGTNHGNNFTNWEMIGIYDNNKNPKIDRGYNRAIITNRQNEGVTNDVSTNERPYTGDRRHGMLIIKPIKN
ncbi:RHS repeat-associated core domain-containing protein [Mucilaginibacter robiniae]|uniref:RHS repeat-associated core domain-containing protein n=1 Tax=Mucilaginibacter robiniae TaxID=2728022 RepID=A0A7L5EBD4_9SPHI|nr:DUF6443 domain-containing protein [Mucilaginibacter robiniae]QJD97706.1 RHS repeat-associated core domain-containing protein [Mucilaginibacter robiniae]